MRKNKPSRRKYTLAAAFLLLLITASLVFIYFTQEPKPDSDSEKIIMEIVAKKLNKDANDLIDADFAKINEIGLGHLMTSSSLTSPSKELADIKILEKCSNLKILRLENINYPAKAIPKWMKILSKMGIFDLNKRFTIDLRPIEKLHSLNHLSIYNVRLKNLEPLAGLTNLQYLSLWYIQISDLEPLKDMVNLQHFSLFGTKVSDIEPLKNLSSLQTLLLSDVPVSNLEPIKNLTNLKTLNLIDCPNITDMQIEDLQKALPNLKIER